MDSAVAERLSAAARFDRARVRAGLRGTGAEGGARRAEGVPQAAGAATVAQDLVGTPLNEALEPTQLFEFAVELANFFLLMWMLKRKKFDGQVFGAYLVIYGVARFFLEFLRGDPGRGSVFGGLMSGTQLIAIGLVILGGVIWWLKGGVHKTVAVPSTESRVASR